MQETTLLQTYQNRLQHSLYWLVVCSCDNYNSASAGETATTIGPACLDFYGSAVQIFECLLNSLCNIGSNGSRHSLIEVLVVLKERLHLLLDFVADTSDLIHLLVVGDGLLVVLDAVDCPSVADYTADVPGTLIHLYNFLEFSDDLSLHVFGSSLQSVRHAREFFFLYINSCSLLRSWSPLRIFKRSDLRFFFLYLCSFPSLGDWFRHSSYVVGFSSSFTESCLQLQNIFVLQGFCDLFGILDFVLELVNQVLEPAAVTIVQQVREVLKNVCCRFFEDFVTLDLFEINQTALAGIVDLVFEKLVAVFFL